MGRRSAPPMIVAVVMVLQRTAGGAGRSGAVTHGLRVERMYDAAPEVIFDAFTDPEAQKEMYADEPGWIVRSECDLQLAGRWTIEFGPPDGRPPLEVCVFEVVDRPRRLVFRSTMSMPDSSSIATRTHVTFTRTAGGQTRLTVVQRGFPAAELRDEFSRGWAQILAGLSPVAAARTASPPGPVPRTRRREWTALGVLALPCLLYAMDLTVLNLTVPAISKSLRPSGTQLLWIVDIYGFVLAGVADPNGHAGRQDRPTAPAAGRRGRVRGRLDAYRRPKRRSTPTATRSRASCTPPTRASCRLGAWWLPAGEQFRRLGFEPLR
jgi:uncharacterized protein YndB with AHSA1/START domain